KPFGAARLVPVSQHNRNELGAQLSADEQFLYCSQPGAMGDDIYRSPRSATGFIGGTVLANVNRDGLDTHPTLTADGLSLVFDFTSPDGGGGSDIFSAARARVDSDFGPPTPLQTLNGPTNETDPYVVGDGHVIYFARFTGRSRIYRADATRPLGFGPPAEVALGIDPSNDVIAPVATPDEKILYF